MNRLNYFGFGSSQTHPEMTVIVDACVFSDGATQENGLYSPLNLDDCLFTLPYNLGVDRALNVGQWPLQLGGRKLLSLTSLYPTVLTTNSLPAGSAFRHLVVNNELWNLAQFGFNLKSTPAPSVCLNSKEEDICSPNVSFLSAWKLEYEIM